MKKSIIYTLILFLSISIQVNSQIKTQESSMWCWASCIQSALFQAIVNQSQSAIVARLAGYPQNRPANALEVASVLRSYNFSATVVNFPANPQQLYSTLSSGWKLIAFVNPSNNPQIGHFIMIQGVAPNGLIIVSDPATGATYRQSLNDLYFRWRWSQSVVVGTP